MQQLRQEVKSLSSLKETNVKLNSELDRCRKELMDIKRIHHVQQAAAVSDKVAQSISRMKPPLAPHRIPQASVALPGNLPSQQALPVHMEEPLQVQSHVAAPRFPVDVSFFLGCASWMCDAMRRCVVGCMVQSRVLFCVWGRAISSHVVGRKMARTHVMRSIEFSRKHA